MTIDPAPENALPNQDANVTEIFQIGFDRRDVPAVIDTWKALLNGNRWSEGNHLAALEEKIETHVSVPSAALSSWAGGALAVFSYFELRGKRVLCPTNTFMATPLAIQFIGAEVVFGDCRRDDLSLSAEAVERAITEGIDAVVLVHIGGHIAFDTEAISLLCRKHGVLLLEDCAHALGATWNGRAAGTWGEASIFSLYATKTITTGEGGFVCSANPDLIRYVKEFRNYGKPNFMHPGLNFRMDEFRAALGCVQFDRLQEIIAWKNRYASRILDPSNPKRLRLPEGMVSSYYKYIVFDQAASSTGRVYDTLCHEKFGCQGRFPNAEWIAQNHSCIPIYYRPEIQL